MTLVSVLWPSVAGALDDAPIHQKQKLVFTLPAGWSDETAGESNISELRTEEGQIVWFQRLALFDQTLSQWIRDEIESYKRKYPHLKGDSNRASASKGFELLTPPREYVIGESRWTMFAWEKPYVQDGRTTRQRTEQYFRQDGSTVIDVYVADLQERFDQLDRTKLEQFLTSLRLPQRTATQILAEDLEAFLLHRAGEAHGFEGDIVPVVIESTAFAIPKGAIQDFMQYLRRDHRSQDLELLCAHIPKEAALKVAEHCKAADSHDVSGSTSLIDAAKNGRTEVVRRLLDAGTQIDVKDAKGVTALAWAASEGRLPVVTVLLERGAAIEVKDNYGWTPLFYAAYKDHGEILTALLAAGADVGVRAKTGVTPLIAASHEGHEQVVSTLLKHGANVHVRTEEGLTALSEAESQGHGAIAQLLRKAGAKE
jgi:ankyrin repeat protein